MNDSFTFPPPNLSCKPLGLTELVAHSENISSLAVSRWTSALAVTGGEDCRVNCWRIGKAVPKLSFAGHTTPVDSVCFDMQDNNIAGGSRGGSIKVWDATSEKLHRTFAAHRSAVIALDFHPYGEYFASGSTDTNVKLWDMDNKGCMQTLKGHEAAVCHVTFTPDGRWLVSGDVSGLTRVVDVTAGKLIHEIRPPKREPIVSFHFHPNEALLAIAYQHHIALHDFDHLRLLSTTPREAAGLRHAMFDPDGNVLVSISSDTCRTWTNWDAPQCHDGCEGRWDGAADISISNNHEVVVASRAKSTMKVELVDLRGLAPFKQRRNQENIATGAGLAMRARQTRDGKAGSGTGEWALGKAEQLSQAKQQPQSSSPATPAAPANIPTVYNASAVSPSDSQLSVSPKPSILASPNAAFFRAHATGSPVVVPSPQLPQSQQSQQPTVQPAAVSGWPVAAAGRAAAPIEQKPLMLPTFEQQLQLPVPLHTSASTTDASRPSFAHPHTTTLLQPQPGATPSVLIPSQPTHPLNLSFSSFLPSPSASPPPPLPSLDGDAIRDRLLEQHDVTLRALSHRRQNLHTLVSLWCAPPAASSASASIRTLCATLVAINDQLVAADFLQSTWPQFSNQPLLTLEAALLLLPLLRSMLSSKYERCVLVAMRYTQLIVGSFGQVVRDSRQAGGGGVDVVGDERRQRCDGVWRELQAVSTVLVVLKGSNDVVESAQQLTASLHDVVSE